MSALPRFDAVLFDCDGVLVDSEAITQGVLRDVLEESGWRLTLDECMAIFLGKDSADEPEKMTESFMHFIKNALKIGGDRLVCDCV